VTDIIECVPKPKQSDEVQQLAAQLGGARWAERGGRLD